eukprot:SAG25_NODE_288_length_10343_cov_3.673858_2_plen_82_part_00
MGADEEESRSTLVWAMVASEREQVRMLLPEAERGTQAQGPNLCFDAAETVCHVPSAACHVPSRCKSVVGRAGRSNWSTPAP